MGCPFIPEGAGWCHGPGNDYTIDFGIAFGGFKQSGVGREGGREELSSYLETKSVIAAIAAETDESPR